MKKTTKSGKVFKDEELRKALFAFQDLMERLGGCVFYPLKKTAEQVHADGELNGYRSRYPCARKGPDKRQVTSCRFGIFTYTRHHKRDD